uniref:Uncharacterized protein n=1 Tax=Kalanchoe fedtschenkoi TaxID=63787 RepID=A0A7N0TF67_KALFE
MAGAVRFWIYEAGRSASALESRERGVITRGRKPETRWRSSGIRALRSRKTLVSGRRWIESRRRESERSEARETVKIESKERPKEIVACSLA